MYNTTSSYGYVRQSDITAPSTSYSMPVTSGYCSQDYKGATHPGVDIAVASGTNAYATATGSVRYRISTKTINGVDYLVNYGNAAFLDVGDMTFLYAHLSAFANGYSANITLPSYREKEVTANHSWLNTTGVNVSKGSTIGKTGNYGLSQGAHLHFETRNNGNAEQ